MPEKQKSSWLKRAVVIGTGLLAAFLSGNTLGAEETTHVPSQENNPSVAGSQTPSPSIEAHEKKTSARVQYDSIPSLKNMSSLMNVSVAFFITPHSLATFLRTKEKELLQYGDTQKPHTAIQFSNIRETGNSVTARYRYHKGREIRNGELTWGPKFFEEVQSAYAGITLADLRRPEPIEKKCYRLLKALENRPLLCTDKDFDLHTISEYAWRFTYIYEPKKYNGSIDGDYTYSNLNDGSEKKGTLHFTGKSFDAIESLIPPQIKMLLNLTSGLSPKSIRRGVWKVNGLKRIPYPTKEEEEKIQKDLKEASDKDPLIRHYESFGGPGEKERREAKERERKRILEKTGAPPEDSLISAYKKMGGGR